MFSRDHSSASTQFLSIFRRETMLEKTQFIRLIENSSHFIRQKNKFNDKISQSESTRYEFQNLKITLQEEAWQDYNIIVDLVNLDQLRDVIYKNFSFISRDRPVNPLLATTELYFEYLEKEAKINLLMIGDWDRIYPDGLNVYGTPLTHAIANSLVPEALDLIERGADINKYAYDFGNNPLLLAITKGWNHSSCGRSQKEIICKLLSCEHIDINKAYLFNGMTALHLACLRGDEPELIEHLLEKGASFSRTDYDNKTPVDYLALDYDSRMNIFKGLYETNDAGGSSAVSWYSIPTREQQYNNLLTIQNLIPNEINRFSIR